MTCGAPQGSTLVPLLEMTCGAPQGSTLVPLLEMTCGAPQGSTLVPLLEMTCGAPQGSTLVPLLEMTCGAPQGSTLVPFLFLIYINGIANSSDKLSFRLFADDANIFYASDDINDIESVINCEITRFLNYYSRNKLSVNMKKLTSC